MAGYPPWSRQAEVTRSGGAIRWTYLRRIRLPAPDSSSPSLSTALKKAFQKRDFAKLDALALKACGIGAVPPFDFVNTRGRQDQGSTQGRMAKAWLPAARCVLPKPSLPAI
ncbi:MAG: hypothetical protein WCE40_14145 [Polyangia bacterium]